MRIVQINAVPYGSTGSIMFSLADVLEAEGSNVLCTTGFSWRKIKRSDYFITSNIFEKSFHRYLAAFSGRIGSFSNFATLKLIKKLKIFNPDIIHLHNLHGWYINFSMLFKYIKENKIPVVWTFHDCWNFTGHCPHFTMIGCEKWKSGCFKCPQYSSYPKTYFDFSKVMYYKKKNWFTNVDDMTIVTPSEWLKAVVMDSFFNHYPIRVINNGIDLSYFQPIKSDFRKKNLIENKFLVLGVAYAWDEKKGLDVFIEMSKILNDDYKIVLVGTDEKVDKNLPNNILSINRTKDRRELAEIYSAADVFVNPTKEENYPTVNMEALACGTPVITFDTGGSGEIPNQECGITIPYGNTYEMIKEVKRVCSQKPYSQENCLRRAKQFDVNFFYQKYKQLYSDIYERNTKG